MGRWVTFFLLVFICGTIIAGSLDYQVVYAVTSLSSSIDDDDATITVVDTTNFPPATSPASGRRLGIGSEVIIYSGLTDTQFTGLTRGASDPQTGQTTEAATHSSGAKVMSMTARTISNISAINLITSGVTFGSLAGYVLTGTALRDLFKTLTWDYPWFRGNWVFARIPLLALSGGFLWAMAIVFLQIAQGILRLG